MVKNVIISKNNFAVSPPCYSAEGDSDNNVFSVVQNDSGPRPNFPQGYSSEVKIQIKLCENVKKNNPLVRSR